MKYAALFALCPLCLAQMAGASGLTHLPQLASVAPEAIAISPHVPHMGTHYAMPGDLPTGPIYCVIEGHVVCVEYMFAASALAEGVSWTGLLPGVETPPITHVDLEFKPDGVGPMQEPIYQLHIYFADSDVLAMH
ncbi:MAG: hypothetical protein JJU15_15190 [Pararhodobacter sp.]|nr:hypothetical protein [Pararhodobacter sp.]